MNIWDPEDNPFRDDPSPWAPSGEIEIGTRLDTGKPYMLPVSNLDYHTLLVGPPRYGKSYFLINLIEQLNQAADAAIVVLDPAGDLYWHLKRAVYTQALDRRLVFIDPGEQRLVAGFNPVTPWPENHELQAALGLDLLRRGLGTQSFADAPRAARWMFDVLFGLIASKSTLHEAPPFLDYDDSRIRNGIATALPAGDVKRDLEWLARVLDDMSDARKPEFLDNQLGSSVNRFRQYVRNPFLRLSLATTQSVIDWSQIINERKIVLVNLQKRRFLGEEDQRLLGLQIVNEIVQEAFRREANQEARIPCYLVIDEFSKFAVRDIDEILSQGRKYKLPCILAHQFLNQLVDPVNNDWRLYHSVLGCCALKIVFGGLQLDDADVLAKRLYYHFLDPKRVKHEQVTWRQLSQVVDVESTVDTTGGGGTHASGTARGSTYTSGESTPVVGDPLRSWSTSTNDQFNDSIASMDTWSHSVIRAKMVQPTAPFEERHPEFWPMEEQLFLHVRDMIRQPVQHATIAYGSEYPVQVKVRTVEEPRISHEQAKNIDLEVMRALPNVYAEPKRIEEEIRDRHAGLLRLTKKPSAKIVVEPTREIEQPPKFVRRQPATTKKKVSRKKRSAEPGESP